MMGYGSYGNGGSYMTPSPSNLSASAPPFTLDRSPKPGSIPAVDFIEPSYSSPMNSSLNNWLPGPTSDLNAYGYRGSQPVVESSSFGQSVESLAKKLPYYPPYLSPTTHTESPFLTPDQSGYICDYPRSSSDSKYGADWGDGLWKQLAEWKQSKQSHGSFGSKESADMAVPSMYENYMNPDAKIPSGLSRVGDTSHSHVVDFMEIEKHKSESLSEKAFSYTKVDYARSVLGPLSGLGETHHQSFSASSDQHSKQHSGSVSSAPFETVRSQFVSGEKPVFDSSLIRDHLARDDRSSLGLFYTKTEETKSGPRIPSSDHENRFNMDLNSNEVAIISSVQESSDGVDQYNHAVDSPCWKGVPIVAHSSSPFESPEAVQATHNSTVQEKLDQVGDQKSDCARSETDNSNALNHSNVGPSVPTVDVPRLVNTIHNLSELLLLHCTNGSSRLFQKDTVAVQSTMINLSLCVSRNIEKRVPVQEPTLSEKDYDYLGDLPIGFTMDQSEVTKGARDMVDEDKATKAFKKVLTENFNEDETQTETLLYKNLWLEAEAALCSLNYKARYNRMKVEMENSKLLKPKETHENTNSTDPRNKKPLLGSLVTPDSDAVETFLATKTPGLSASSPGSHDDDVMSRFQILRCRVENSNHSSPTATTAADKPPNSSKEAAAKTLLPEEKLTPKPEIPNSGKNKDISDFDASVMARFHILKSRGENFNNQSSAETKLARFASQRTNWPIIGSIQEVMGEIPEEGRFTVFGEGQSQSNDPYGTENLAILRASLDWEHVRKEDLGWQNR